MLVEEYQELRSIAEDNPCCETVFIAYLCAVQCGDEERTRMAKAFILFFAGR